MSHPQQPAHGVLIESARLGAGISLAQAIKLADVAKDTWINTVRGRNKDGDTYEARPRTVARMAHAVNVSPDRMAAEGRRPDAAAVMREITREVVSESPSAAPLRVVPSPLAPPPLEQGDDPFPGIAPEIEPDVMAEFGLIEPVVREVQARHPEVAIRGEWVFPGGGRESRIWDNLTAIGFSPWQRAMALAVIRVTDRAQSGSDSGTGLSKSALPEPG